MTIRNHATWSTLICAVAILLGACGKPNNVLIFEVAELPPVDAEQEPDMLRSRTATFIDDSEWPEVLAGVVADLQAEEAMHVRARYKMVADLPDGSMKSMGGSELGTFAIVPFQDAYAIVDRRRDLVAPVPSVEAGRAFITERFESAISAYVAGKRAMREEEGLEWAD